MAVQEMRVQEMTAKYILIYPQTLILYDSMEEAMKARTKVQKRSDMEIYKVEYAGSLPEEKETA